MAPERGRRRDEMRAISGSHALLTNIVLAWNTDPMHEVIERLKREGTRIEDDWLRRIGPAHFAHINFRGTMRFGVDKYAHSLVQRQPSLRSAGRIADRLTTVVTAGKIGVMSRQTMSFALPESMREYIDARVSAGSYGNTSEYIRDLVRRDQEEQAKKQLRQSDRRGPVLRTGAASNQSR